MTALKFGLFLPPFGALAEPDRVIELALAAEGSGWDGFFLWDHILALPGMAVPTRGHHGCGSAGDSDAALRHARHTPRCAGRTGTVGSAPR
jgi:alkanesulfonate monooxygenase SsuD/methylene tetrahydromethanopterin reductase-like flavin-dependent oxidoreductase (luciferase family)